MLLQRIKQRTVETYIINKQFIMKSTGQNVHQRSIKINKCRGRLDRANGQRVASGIFGVVPDVQRTGELFGLESRGQLFPSVSVVAEGHQLSRLELSRLVQHLEQLYEVVMFQLHLVSLKTIS
jgi:hypothetical protein